MARTIPMGGYQHSFEREAAELVPDIFVLDDVSDISKAASSVASSTIDVLTELVAGGSECNERCKAWLTLVGSALGFGKDSKDQNKRSSNFCTTLLDHFPALILALRRAYESHRTKQASESFLELRRAVSLFGIVLVVLRDHPNLPSVLRTSRACAVREQKMVEAKQKISESGVEEEAPETKATVGESLASLLARMLAEGGDAQERSGWYRLPLKIILLVLNAVLMALTPKTAKSDDDLGADALTRRTGKECGEWDLRDLAARITSTHCPVIVSEVKGELRCSTFRTITPASQEALNIMEAAAAKGARSRAKVVEGDSPMTAAEWFCREAYHYLEGCIDAVVTAYLGVFA
eukprot:CAMPEP_0167780196 /NCGR_PEP_ID=MMETSP0111_2-20121227/5222_1 /TAXON_ID=91324 /ORGANISM="Lotharella globosa, Strain CCCM811" /LENGTH=349 /DNA_ID=CAMNT_0007670679 /DNA_START=63 /DNA_END=1110 /DNA_ORIENTATION=-